MVTSMNAMCRVTAGTLQELQDYGVLCGDAMHGGVINETVAPEGIHLLVKEKRFTGKHSPIIFILEDGLDTMQAVPVIMNRRERSTVVNRAKKSVKKNAVIWLETYSIVPRYIGECVDQEGRYQVNLVKYKVVKKDISDDEVCIWRNSCT